MVLKSSERRIEHPPQTGLTEHEYMRGRGASGGLAGAPNHEIKLTPKPTPTPVPRQPVSG